MKISELKTGDVVERYEDVQIRTSTLPLKKTKYRINIDANGDILGQEMREEVEVVSPVKLVFTSDTWYFYQRRDRKKEGLADLVGRVIHVNDDTTAMLVAYNAHSNWFTAGDGEKYHAKTAESLCGYVYELVKIDTGN